MSALASVFGGFFWLWRLDILGVWLGGVMCGGDGDGDGDGEDRWLVHMVRHGDGGKDGMSDGDGEK